LREYDTSLIAELLPIDMGEEKLCGSDLGWTVCQTRCTAGGSREAMQKTTGRRHDVKVKHLPHTQK
jgi:hypothetical protein